MLNDNKHVVFRYKPDFAVAFFGWTMEEEGKGRRKTKGEGNKLNENKHILMFKTYEVHHRP